MLRRLFSKIIENESIIRVREHPTVVLWRSDLGDLRDHKKQPHIVKNKKNHAQSTNKKNKNSRVRVVSRQSPRSPRSPSANKIMEEKTTARILSKTKIKIKPKFVPIEINPTFSFGDFQCTQCSQKFTSEVNRSMHTEAEHPNKHKLNWSSGKWYCKNCKENGDKFDMQGTCKGHISK